MKVPAPCLPTICESISNSVLTFPYVRKMATPYVRKCKRKNTPHNPMWILTHGACDVWANEFINRIGGEIFWLDEEYENCFHCVVKYEGKYYDAECSDGVEKIEDIPFFQEWWEGLTP